MYFENAALAWCVLRKRLDCTFHMQLRIYIYMLNYRTEYIVHLLFIYLQQFMFIHPLIVVAL